MPPSCRVTKPTKYNPLRGARPAAAFRQRYHGEKGYTEGFGAPEVWHDPTGRDHIRFITEPAGAGYLHPVTSEEALERIGNTRGTLEARVLGRIATALSGAPDPSRRSVLAAEAVALARELGDRDSLAFALSARHLVRSLCLLR